MNRFRVFGLWATGRRKLSLHRAWFVRAAFAYAGAVAMTASAAGCGSTSDGGGAVGGFGSGGAEGALDGAPAAFGSRTGSGSTDSTGSGGSTSGSSNGQSSGAPRAGGAADASAEAGSRDSDAGDREGGPFPDSGDAGSGDAGPRNDAGGSACGGGRSLLASDATGGSGTPVTGYGEVTFQTSTGTQITELQTTLTVPAKPTSSSTLFIWPGLEPLPGSANFNPVNYGVLQPVLTWGTSCAPNSPTNSMGWWISGLYVNTYTSDQALNGCLGGNVIDVAVGESLDITMSLKGTVWSQVVVDRQSGQKATYDVDLLGQAQDWALFKIEETTQTTPSSDVVFTATTLTFAAADPMGCQPNKRGTNDYFAAPQSSADGTKCCISRLVLRAQGVPATTPNGP